MTDPIADMLTRIRNALAAQKLEVVFPCSRIKADIVKILKEHGYVANFEILQRGKTVQYDQIRVELKYKKPKVPAILSLKRVSTPGRRVYVTKDMLPNVLNNLGIGIISTSQGVMTNIEARKRKLGGEYVCEVY